jgi:lipoprotein NlpI
MNLLRNMDVEGSIRKFDDAIQLRPELRRLLWQRGLSLYYADRFNDCAQQFRDDIALNPQDAEEIVWTALCESRFRTGGFAEAVTHMPELPLPERRPVMRAVLSLFRGANGAEKQLMGVGNTAADSSKSSPDYFYSRLYLSLWHEAQGHTGESAAFIRDAVNSEYGRTSRDYMAALAKVHAKLRLVE